MLGGNTMHKLLIKMSSEELATLIEEIINDMKSNGMLQYYNKYKTEIEDVIYCIKPEEAKEIVWGMKPYGEMYAMDNVKAMIAANGIPTDKTILVRYYLTMNMYANDARQVAEENGLQLDKFCFIMAKSFINDIDAGPHKVEKYFKDIV